MEIELRIFEKRDPIHSSLPSALKVVQQLLLYLKIPEHVVPAACRFGHQGVMICVIVAENETPVTISPNPVHNPDTLTARNFSNNPLRNVNPVMENGTVKMDIAQEFTHRKGRKQGSFEVA